jgi:6-phosphogluconolactonase/glucosamine-6-phosphate isomerase/deaminase
VDERHVPQEHVDSNYRVVQEALAPLQVPPLQLHAVRTELPLAAAGASPAPLPCQFGQRIMN